MTVANCTAAEKREIVEAILVSDFPLNYEQQAILRAICVDYRSQTSEEVGKVRLALTDQVGRARREKERVGDWPRGTLHSLGEALCGRWFLVIDRALERFEREVST
jgi:hypothetical protein